MATCSNVQGTEISAQADAGRTAKTTRMPDKIGRYEIQGELGKGAMGVVYRAVDPTIGRPVALKTMRVDIHGADSEDMLKRFQNEARAAGVLNHPNIVTIYDAGEAEGVFYIAMEFIPGKTLAQVLLEQRACSAEQIVNFGTQICAGLDYAHSKKVIHRDIKPPNIMIAPDGTAKIMDFGIAKAGASLTQTGEVLGTPNYMSPEQVKGKDLDGRTDLFSTGVILYEMATGERPFNGQNVTTIIYKIINENPPAPRELDVTVHPGLSQVIVKCLSKDPEDRYQNGADLAMALKSYKIVSVAEPRGASAPVASPNATGFATRPMQAASPTVLRTAAPASAAAAAAKAASSKPEPAAHTEPIRLKPVIQPPAKPAPQPKSNSGTIAGVVLIVIIALAGMAGIKKFAGKNTSIGSNTTPALTEPATSTESTPTHEAAPGKPSGMVATPFAPKVKTAPKPATPVEGVGELRVTSNPPGAQIEIDGISQDWYTTPFNAPPMKSGTHTIRANAPGLPSQTRQVDVVAGQKITLDFQMAANKAIYNISSAPTGAEVVIDGVPTGRTTPTQMALTPGQHRVVLRMDGFSPTEVMADADAGQSINLAPALKAKNSAFISQQSLGDNQSLGSLPNLRRFYANGEIPDGMGALDVRTRPRGVTILVDGASVPKPTPFKFPLKPGTHNITLMKDGFETVTRTVQIQLGQQQEIEEILPPQR
jgi:predicted Ser/Thr protein kinase